MNEVPFGQLFKKVVDNRGKTCPTSTEGTTLIATNCIKNNYLYPVFEKVRYVDENTLRTWFRGHPKPGNIIFVTKGTPGRVAWVPDKVNFCIAQDMVALDVDEKKIDPRYLFAALRSKDIQAEIENLHVGSLIPHFKKGDFDRLFIPLPERRIQEYIGELYFSLNHKIDLLHRQNKTLEEMAEALFRQWFVEEIDDKWADGLIEDVAENISLSISPGKIPPGSPYIGLEHINRRNISLFEIGDSALVESNKNKFLRGDILFGKLRPYFHKVTIAPFDGVCSTDILVIRPKYEYLSAYCLFLLFQDEVVDYSDISSGGTRMPRTSWSILGKYPIKIPPESVLTTFNTIVMEYLTKIFANVDQIRNLVAIRDTLLPKLMSGQVKVYL